MHDAGFTLLRTDEPELPFLGAHRRRRRDPARLGATRRLDGDRAAPREELAVRHRAAVRDLRGDRARARTGRSASVARNSNTSAPSLHDTNATICPGSACSSSETSSTPACAAPALPTVPERSSMTCTPSSFPPTPRATVCGRRGDGRQRDVTRSEPGALERGVPRRHPEGRVDDLAEALVPDSGTGLARRPPPLDELVGHARTPRGTPPAPCRRRRCPPRTRRRRRHRRLRRRRRGGRCGCRRSRRARAWPRAPAGGRRPPNGPTRRGRTPRSSAGSRSAACTAVALVLSA